MSQTYNEVVISGDLTTSSGWREASAAPAPAAPSHTDHCCTERPPGARLSEGITKEATEAMLDKRGLMRGEKPGICHYEAPQ